MVAVTIERTAKRKFKGASKDAICGAPDYLTDEHREMPHVVRFSGGRSSAAMVLSLARSKALAAERNDVVLFANTTAEHPETYEFARKVCDELEAEHGIPCFWFEFCTYETASRTGWRRREGYRLVDRTRKATPDDPPFSPGYREDGSAFEALASLRAMLPNRSLRFCTQALKVRPGIELLGEWFSGGPGPRHLGHHHPEPQSSPADDAERYAGKQFTQEAYETIRGFAHQDPPARPEQRWQIFTQVELKRKGGQRPEVDLAGRHGTPFKYLTLLGLRADEPKRVNRALFDAMLNDGTTGSKCRYDSHPAGESIACPLSDHEATKESVDIFWKSQPYDLGIDGRQGNCVYCPMKGEAALRALAANEETKDSGPMSIGWWADIESRYGRAATSEGADRFRFLSLRAPSYAEIAADPSPREGANTQTLPCQCGD